MGRSAKSTRGGNKRRINPGRLAKKFTRQGMSDRAAGVAARAAAKMSLAAPRDRAAALANLPPKMAKRAAAAVKRTTANKTGSKSGGNNNVSSGGEDDARSLPAQQNQQQQQQKPAGVKAQIQSALAQLQQQRNLQEQRTVVKQAMRRTKK